MISENRTKALQWWNNLTEEEKENFFAGYKLYTPATSYTQLTGREIQNIWLFKQINNHRNGAICSLIIGVGKDGLYYVNGVTQHHISMYLL